MNNSLFLNGKNIGIGEIEFDKAGNLRIVDKSFRYCLVICVKYNIEDINSIKIGEKRNIEFNEYYVSEKNESALISPSISLVEKINKDIFCFTFKFENLDNKTCYMNTRKHFDIKLESLKCKIYLDNKDAKDGIILYKY